MAADSRGICGPESGIRIPIGVSMLTEEQKSRLQALPDKYQATKERNILIDEALLLHPKKSNADIAMVLGVCHQRVCERRKILEYEGKI